MVSLKYLSNFWRTLEISLFNCEINLQLACSKKMYSSSWYSSISSTKIESNWYKFLTLSTQENIKLLKQLESGFKRTINFNKYLSKNSSETQNRCFTVLTDLSSLGVNRFFVLSFDGDDGRKSYRQFYLPTVEIK